MGVVNVWYLSHEIDDVTSVGDGYRPSTTPFPGQFAVGLSRFHRRHRHQYQADSRSE